MKKFVLPVFFFLLLFLSGPARCSSTLPKDTLSLRKADFADSAAVRKLIDSVYAQKEGDPLTALALIKYAYNRAAEQKNMGLEASALNVQGSVFGDLSDYQSALKNLYQSLRLFEKYGDAYNVAMVTNNIGKVYSESGKPAEALRYLSAAENKGVNGKLNKVLLYVYVNFANTYVQLNQLKKALNYALRADSINRYLNLKMVRARNANTIGAIYYFLNDLPNSLKYYEQSKALALEISDLSAYQRANINIGEVYEVTHQQDPLSYYFPALKYFTTTNDYRSINYVAGNISNYYKAKGDYKHALEYNQLAVTANEKNKSLQAAKNMSLLQTQYETEKKTQQIVLLNKENTIQRLSIAGRNKTIGLITGLFLLSAIMIALAYNRKKLQQKAEMQQQLLRQQEQVARAVIEAEEKERQRIASDLHDGVGQLFSAVRMNLNGLFDRVKPEREEDRFLAEKTMALVEESCKEVRVISHQMMPNMLLRSGIASDVKSFIEKLDSETLKVNLEATGFKNKLESNVETVLYRVIQETVNNVIKHAKANALDIRLTRDAKGINAVIADNGVGFDTTLANDFEGIGLKNIATRIEYLKGQVTYTSSPGNGTRVELWVPVT